MLLGGHLTLWDPGLLCYNLVLSGFDLSEAAVLLSHDVGLVTQKKPIRAFGDVGANGASFTELADLSPYFPFAVKQRCNGLVKSANWGGLEYNLPDPCQPGHIHITGRNLPAEGLFIPYSPTA